MGPKRPNTARCCTQTYMCEGLFLERNAFQNCNHYIATILSSCWLLCRVAILSSVVWYLRGYPPMGGVPAHVVGYPPMGGATCPCGGLPTHDISVFSLDIVTVPTGVN